MAARRSALWTCPRCGVKLVTRNGWHSCGQATLQNWLARMSPAVRRLYDRFEAMIASFGEYHVAPAKTRIAFLGQVRFANITKISDDSLSCTFSLPQKVRSPRLTKVQEVIPGWWVHTMQVRKPSEFDREMKGWFRESYRLMGMRERLSR